MVLQRQGRFSYDSKDEASEEAFEYVKEKSFLWWIILDSNISTSLENCGVKPLTIDDSLSPITARHFREMKTHLWNQRRPVRYFNIYHILQCGPKGLWFYGTLPYAVACLAQHFLIHNKQTACPITSTIKLPTSFPISHVVWGLRCHYWLNCDVNHNGITLKYKKPVSKSHAPKEDFQKKKILEYAQNPIVSHLPARCESIGSRV